MRNHFHLVIETPEAHLVAGMSWLLSAYTIRLNHRHQLFGHVFSGRYNELKRLGRTEKELHERRTNDPEKLGIGARLRRETTLTLKHRAQRISLGSSKSANAKLHQWMRGSNGMRLGLRIVSSGVKLEEPQRKQPFSISVLSLSRSVDDEPPQPFGAMKNGCLAYVPTPGAIPKAKAIWPEVIPFLSLFPSVPQFCLSLCELPDFA